MKAPYLMAGLIVVLVVQVVLQHGRIAKLQERLAFMEAENRSGPVSERLGSERPMGTKMAGERVARGKAKDGDREEVEDVEASLGTSLRKMAENPAGQAMMNQGVKAMSMMWYADLVEQFDLNKEEGDYFLALVAGSMSAQQQIGMKMMGAESPEERQALMDEIKTAKEEAKEAVKSFLNDDDDFAAYEDYEARLPERQQLDGIRATMNGAGAALSPEQEQGVIDAMYQVRTSQTDAVDWSGTGGMEAIANGGAVETFEDNWNKSAARMTAEVGKVLEGEQLEAFQDYREQMKEMQLIGIKMAEKMFRSEGDAEVEGKK